MPLLPAAWRRPEGRLVPLFLAVTLLPAAGLVWLGWTLITEDRNLAATQLRARLDDAADQVAAEIALDLQRLDPTRITLPPDGNALALVLSPDGIVRHTGLPLPFGPWPALPEAPAEALAEASAIEWSDSAAALARYRTLAETADRALRAAALLGVGRLQRDERPNDALKTWAAMEEFDDVAVFGDPASLQAALARLRKLDDLGRPGDRAALAEAVVRDLRGGRWRIGRLAYDTAVATAGPEATQAEADESLALAEAVDDTWREWRRRVAAGLGGTWDGHDAIDTDGQRTMRRWQSDSSTLTLVAAAPAFFVNRWRPHWIDRGVLVTLEDGDGSRWIDDAGAATDTVQRSPGESGLPWTVRVASANYETELATFAGRRQQILLVLSLAAFLAVAGAYFVARGVRRELAVAKLQSDFVSAVSHEFRTPLTSMSHLIELLRDRPHMDDDRRARYYEALDSETSRLRRFVEQLLDFGRLDAGAAHYRTEPTDLPAFVSGVVDAFAGSPAARGHQIDWSAAPGAEASSVEIDPEAMTLAFNNLLENAAKYSPAKAPIRVRMAVDSANLVRLTVADGGQGIPAGEHERIFEKFVRGSDAAASGVRGTGVGLALARGIVRAHGGDLTVESEAGHGSTFSMVLPASFVEAAGEPADVACPAS